MVYGYYYKKLLVVGNLNKLYKAFLVYGSRNVYVLFLEFLKHEIWRYFK